MENNFKIDEDDLKEIKNMPLCAEKLLITLMFEFSRVDGCDTLINDIQVLKERMELEGLNTYDVDQLFKDLKIMLRRNDMIGSFNCLKQIHGSIRELNIPKLFRLTKENNDALDIVKDQNIYMFIGLTGSGM